MRAFMNCSFMPDRISLRYYIEHILFRLALWLATNLPARIIDGLSAALWRFIAPRLRRHRRALKNLEAAMPELTPAERSALLDRMWDNLGRTSVEALALHQIADDPNAASFNFSADVLQIMNSEQPAIFIGLHAGNWEVPAIAAEKFNKPLMGVYQKIINPLVDNDILELRQRFYKGGLYGKGRETVSRIRRGIEAGFSLAIMSDLRDAHGQFVDFFGLKARSTVFPALLARLHNIPIIAIRAVRLKNRRFRVDALRIELASYIEREETICENTKRIQKQLEAWIREDPALWMWGHNRWDISK